MVIENLHNLKVHWQNLLSDQPIGYFSAQRDNYKLKNLGDDEKCKMLFLYSDLSIG